MPIFLFHGDNQTESLAQLHTLIQDWRQQGYQLQSLDGKKLTPAELSAVLEQDDFFVSKRALVIKNLMTRPKSKIRDQLVKQLQTSDWQIAWWEGKKLTAASVKSIGASKVSAAKQTEAVWGLLAALSQDNNNARFVQLYEQTLAQAQSGNKSDAGIYLLATLLWQIQQLIDAKQNNFHGIPFQRTKTQQQAAKLTIEQLIDWHQRLVDLDYQAKTGQLSQPLSQAMLLVLLS